MYPLAAIFSRQPPIRFFITNDATGFLIPFQASTEFHRKVRENATGTRNVTLLDIGYGPLPFTPGRQEILHVPPRRRGRKEFRLLVLDVLRILVALVDEIASLR